MKILLKRIAIASTVCTIWLAVLSISGYGAYRGGLAVYRMATQETKDVEPIAFYSQIFKATSLTVITIVVSMMTFLIAIGGVHMAWFVLVAHLAPYHVRYGNPYFPNPDNWPIWGTGGEGGENE